MTGILGVTIRILASFGLVFTASASMAQTRTLKVVDFYPPAHFIPTVGTKPWMERITSLTGGKVKFEYYPAEQLGKLNDLPRLLRSGVADISLVGAGLLPTEFPLATIVGLPAPNLTPSRVTTAYWSFVSTDTPIRAEFTARGMEPLVFFGTPQYELFTSKRKVETLDDLRGLKIRTNGGLQAQVVQAIGAVSVQIPAPELYAGLERGIVDGTLLPNPSAKSYRIEEVAKFGTENIGLGAIVIGYAMATAKWQALPQDIKDAFLTANKEFMDRISEYQEKSNVADAEYLKSKGVSVVRLNEAQRQAIVKQTEGVTKDWVKTISERGIPAQAIYDQWQAALAK